MTPEPTGPVRLERLRRGLTQEELAQRCAEAGAPVTESQIGRIERRQMTPRPKLRSVLAELLGLDVTDIGAEPKAKAS